MSKYDVRICGCGHIHFVPNEMIDEAIDNNKNVLLICGGCGQATMIGADARATIICLFKLCIASTALA